MSIDSQGALYLDDIHPFIFQIKVHLNIVDHLLVVEGLDLHATGDPVVDLVVGKYNPQLELSLVSIYPVHDFPFRYLS